MLKKIQNIQFFSLVSALLSIAIPYVVLAFILNGSLRQSFKGWQALYFVLPVIAVFIMVLTVNKKFNVVYFLKILLVGYLSSSFSYFLLSLLIVSPNIFGASLSQILLGVFFIPIHILIACVGVFGACLVWLKNSYANQASVDTVTQLNPATAIKQLETQD